MEFREISTFLQVAQHQSFSKAAKQLGYSQAAVTIQIKQLENELGVHLFDRIGKQISLTHQGQVFLSVRQSAIQKDLAQARRRGLRLLPTLNGKLCLGTIESICASIFPELLSEYHRLYPEVTISIVDGLSRMCLLERMNENAIDIVYLLDRRIYDSRWCKTLEDAGGKYLRGFSRITSWHRANRELELEEVLQFSVSAHRKGCQLPSYARTVSGYLQTALSGRFWRSAVPNSLFTCCLKNTGISFLPEFTIRREVEQKRLTALKVRGFQMQTWRQIFYHKDKWVTREMQEFLRLAREMS